MPSRAQRAFGNTMCVTHHNVPKLCRGLSPTNLCACQPGSEVCSLGPRLHEAVELEGHHRPGVQAQGACVLREVAQDVGRVEEPHLTDTQSCV